MRRRVAGMLGASGAGLAALAAAAGFADIPTLIIWNASGSAPEGLYTIQYRPPEIGDYALVRPSAPLRKLIGERRYLPPATPLIKRVAARGGAVVCRRDGTILIDDIVVAYALATDSLGRDMPRWEGCLRLGDGELFLLNDHEKSLDGRYFGATKADDVIGVGRPLWVIADEKF